MPSKIASAEPESDHFREEIIIERREIVGTIVPGYGTETMLEAAFKMGAQYFAEELRTDSGMRLSFAYGSHQFELIADPIPQK